MARRLICRQNTSRLLIGGRREKVIVVRRWVLEGLCSTLVRARRRGLWELLLQIENTSYYSACTSVLFLITGDMTLGLCQSYIESCPKCAYFFMLHFEFRQIRWYSFANVRLALTQHALRDIPPLIKNEKLAQTRHFYVLFIYSFIVFVCLFVYLFTYLFIHSFVCLFTTLFILFFQFIYSLVANLLLV